MSWPSNKWDMRTYKVPKKRAKALWTTLPVAKAAKTPPKASKSASGAPKRKKGALWTTLPGQKAYTVKNPLANERRLYRQEARAFVRAAIKSGGTCPVVAAVEELRNGRRYGWPVSAKLNEVHHLRGRRGKLLRDQRHWLTLSKAGHRWVHQNPCAAREMGWLCPVGQWNKIDNSM